MACPPYLFVQLTNLALYLLVLYPGWSAGLCRDDELEEPDGGPGASGSAPLVAGEASPQGEP